MLHMWLCLVMLLFVRRGGSGIRVAGCTPVKTGHLLSSVWCLDCTLPVGLCRIGLRQERCQGGVDGWLMIRRAKLDGLALVFDRKDDGGIVKAAAVVENNHTVCLGRVVSWLCER
jgi:hypothetical protein